MINSEKEDQLWMLLGEMRSDLRFLVEERRSTNRRLDNLEARIDEKFMGFEARVGKLEAFKIRVGVFTAALGVLVPTLITVIAHKLGLF
jgi:hypothetical protein